jgi:magnesium transporter
VVFMPLNVIAGVGGMSEFTMMTKTHGIPWPVAYGAFMAGLLLLGWSTYVVLRQVERRAIFK